MGFNFQPPSKSLTARDYQFIALSVLVFLGIAAALILANLSLGGGGEFYVQWMGSRAFLFDKVDPYSWQVAVQTQGLVYQAAAVSGQEPLILDTPFHLLPFYFPFALLPDPSIARAVFTMILELALAGLVFMSLLLVEWQGPRFLTVSFILFVILNYYSIQAVLEASPVVLLGLMYAAMLLALRMGADELLGALIAISMYYWEVGGPLLFLIAIRVSYEKRSRVLIGFLMLSVILVAVSLLLYPGWVIPYLRAAWNNLNADFGLSLHKALGVFWPSPHRGYAWILIGIFALILAYEWSAGHRLEFPRFFWVACLTIALTPLLGFRTEMENLTVLALPLIFIFVVARDRWKKIGNHLTILLVLIGFSIPWILFFLARGSANPRTEYISFLFLPILTVVGLYWIRWWVLGPPRTWLDQVKRS